MSLNYTVTTTTTTLSQLHVQETRGSSEANDKEDDGDKDDKQGKAALASVLTGPSDPANPLANAAPVQSSALDIIKNALQSYQSASEDDHKDRAHASKGQGNAFGRAVGDNTRTQTKNAVQAAYTITQLNVTTTSLELSLVA